VTDTAADVGGSVVMIAADRVSPVGAGTRTPTREHLDHPDTVALCGFLFLVSGLKLI